MITQHNDKIAYVWDETTKTIYYTIPDKRTKLLYVPHTSDMHYMNPNQVKFVSWNIVRV